MRKWPYPEKAISLQSPDQSILSLNSAWFSKSENLSPACIVVRSISHEPSSSKGHQCKVPS